MAVNPESELIAGKAYHDRSVFIPENLLREARRQRGLGGQSVPDACVLDEPVTVLLPKKRAKGTRALDTTRVDLTAEQVEALLVALPERTRGGHPIRDVFTVAWDTGLRHGGLFRLEAGRHFKRGRRELHVSADIDKAGWARPIPLTERARHWSDLHGVRLPEEPASCRTVNRARRRGRA